ncbi:MAG: FAD-dependent monooxygenase [Actinobacteria bacterium]|nr:FAD-dependent monooxygenase [Actinomycetota bacterium]
MTALTCDIAVVGCGPAGATAALTLARLGVRAVVIERSRYDEPRVGETLPPSGCALLRHLELDDVLAGLATPSFGNRSVWGDREPRSSSFVLQPEGEGAHLDRRAFDRALADRVARAGATLLEGTSVTRCHATASGSWKLEIGSRARTQHIRAGALIDTSGRAARIARWVGGARVVRDRLVGVASHHERGPEAGAYTLIEATPHGWWYSAPVLPDRMVVMLMTDADLCRRHRYADASAWERHLAGAEATHARAAGWRRIGRPQVFSAISHRLRRPDSSARWLAAGDAAVAVDPLSSSGMTRALLTGYAAAHAMAHALDGRPEPAREYETRLDSDFDAYWRERAGYYGLEGRWPASPFWQRRAA